MVQSNWHYENEPDTREALDLIFSHFCPMEPGVFEPIRDMLLKHGDYYMHLADLTAYANAQGAVSTLFREQDAWTRKSIINVGSSGKFSSDRTIAEYAADIWKVEPVYVNQRLN